MFSRPDHHSSSALAEATRRFAIVLLLLFAAPCSQHLVAGVGQWTTSGPEGAPVSTLAADPSAPSTVYLATPRHLYKSVDAGEHWIPTGLATSVYRVVPTSDPSVVYALGSFPPGLHRSRDGGETWVTPALRNFFSAIASDPRNPAVLYANSHPDGLLRSSNGGDDWESLPGIPADASISAVAVDPTDSRVIYVSVSGGPPGAPGTYRSVDRGATWERSPLSASYVFKFAFDPQNGSRLFAGSTSGVWVTTNRGESWSRVGTFLRNSYAFSIDPADSNRMYVVTDDGIYRSSDGGVTSTLIPASTFGGIVGDILALSNSVVLAGSFRGLSRSSNSGSSWAAGDIGIREVSVSSISIDPADPLVVFAASPQGVYQSRDGGSGWTPSVPEDPGADTIAFDPSDRSTLYTAGPGVRKSTDGGRTWVGKDPSSDGFSVQISELVIDPNNPRRILAGYYHVYRTEDAADHWTSVLTPDDEYSSYYYPATVSAIAFAPSDSSTVYAGGGETSAFLYRSDDGGANWSDLRPGFDVKSLAVDACDPGVLHAGGHFGAYRTIDGGASWGPVQLAGAQVYALARDPRHPTSVFAGTIAGLFWTNDRGATWTRFEPVLEHPIHSLALDATGRFLYAGTDHGVYALERTFEPCSAGLDRLCLVGGKFQVSIRARDPRMGASISGRAIVDRDQFGYFSFPDVTGDPTFPEVFVKMVDATGAPAPYGGHTWVFHSSLTDLDYTLTVLETESGRVRKYIAEDATSLTCGAADTSAFVRACEAVEGSSESPGATPLAASSAELPLLNGRFRATLRATDPRSGRTGEGEALPKADGFGYFSLPAFTGDPTFPEVFVKMTDATALAGGNFWVFHTGLTDLDYTLTVTDRTTGAIKTYRRGPPQGTELCGQADTAAFRN